MTTSAPQPDPIMLAAAAAKALSQNQRFAYAHLAPDLTLHQISPNFKVLIPNAPTNVIGLPISDLMDELVGLDDILTAVLHNEMPAFRLDNINREHADGTIDYFNFQVTPFDTNEPQLGLLLLIEDNTPLGRIQQNIVQDRNQLRLVQNQLAHAYEELQRLNQLKSLFLSMAAHDLRSPLTVVHLHAELLAEQLSNDNAIHSTEIITSQIQRLNYLINDLLDLEKIEQGKLTVNLEKCDLAKIAENVLATMDIYIRTEKRQASLDIPAPHLFVQADAQRVWQILYNLISNAIKYTRRQGTIQVSVETKGQEVALHVQDDGRGMTPEQLERLFTPFYRTKEAQESKISGTGLGLYITKALVDAHNGRIEVRSQLNKGSTFTVYLPLYAT